ncbi:MAG: hypothetical protein P8185_05210 [Deltaproteobacteria bacterium]|jgi:hypothetical protein
MKKRIIIISVVLIGFIMVLTANSWAQRENAGKRRGDRSDHFQKWDKPAIHKFDRERVRADRNRGHQYGPAKGFKQKTYKNHLYRAPNRLSPKFRFWQHWPTNRRVYPKRFLWRNRHSAVNHINNYYGAADSYAASEEAFLASASVSDSGFSVSVGVSKTD